MSDQEVRISYFQKNPTSCPVCASKFKREEMLSGGGRLIARDITDELRRIYVPSKKVGTLYPLVYPVTVCPYCLYAAFHEDFPFIQDKYKPVALSQKEKRKSDIKLLFPIVDFKKQRNLFSGTASYILAIAGYSFQPKHRAPTFKKALSALRAAWLFDDLDKRYPGQNYDKIKLLMYKKSMLFYQRCIALAQSGGERIDAVKNFGPDLDKNYGYEGMLYIFSLLLYKYGDIGEKQETILRLKEAKRTISKVFGSGKSSKAKPSYILERSKELYEKLTARIEEIEAE